MAQAPNWSHHIFNLRTAHEYAKSCQKDHVALREAYLPGLAEAIVTKQFPHLDTPGNLHLKPAKVAHKLRELIKSEQRQRMYRKIGRCLQPNSENLGGLARVDIPAGNGHPYPDGPDPKTWTGAWTTVTLPEEIARHACASNTRQYNQAANTPFATEPLATYIGPAATADGADQILRGEPTPEAVHPLLQPETLQLLHTISSTSKAISSPPVEVDISFEAFQSCYKTVTENTSSSPSGRHVGHYKAAVMCDALSALHAAMMTIPFQAGFSPKLWQCIIDILLEKQPGNARIHQLCILALLESDASSLQGS
jgi:hypothetical protein